MRDATHHTAVSALIANVPQIKLLVRHDRPPQGLQVRPFYLKAFYRFERVSIGGRGGGGGVVHPFSIQYP